MLSFGLLIGIVFSFIFTIAVKSTSDASFCVRCHTMKPVVASYYDDLHGGKNKTGVRASCTDCHLPHDNLVNYLFQKGRTGIHDVYAEIFKDKSKINWEERLDHREEYTYDSGCLKCHSELEEATLTNKKSFLAHKHYFSKTITSQCTTCHPHVGHKNIKSHFNKTKSGGLNEV